MELTKADLNKLLKFWNTQLTKINNTDLEEFAGALSEKADNYEEKGNDEKAELYNEVSEKLQEVVDALNNVYDLVCDYV